MNQIERQRVAEREELINLLRADLEGNPAVAAAWFHGSIGRGEQDPWSDIDVWIVLEDNAFPQVALGRQEEAAKLGKPVLFVESSYNAPPGGVYLMAGYDCPSGIQLIDWYWQPVSAARKPDGVQMIVTRKELPEGARSETPPFPVWDPTPEQDAVNCGALAWAMIAIQAKYVIRKPGEIGMGFQRFIETLMGKAAGEPFDFGDAESIQGSAAKLERLSEMSSELKKTTFQEDGSVVRFLRTVKTTL